MKTFFSLIICHLVLLSSPLAQEAKVIEELISNAGNKTVQIDLNYPNLEVETWNRNDIVIEGFIDSVVLFEEHDFELAINETQDRVSISLKNDNDDSPKVAYLYDGEEKQLLKIKFDNWRSANKEVRKKCSDCSLSIGPIIGMLTIKVKLPKSTNLNIETVYSNNKVQDFYGPLDVDATYGGVTVVYSDRMPETSVTLSSTYDFVDITLPSAAKADLDLKTPYGEIFSNFDVKVAANLKDNSPYGSEIRGTINGGGNRLKVVANYDNIYLRKL